MAGVSQEITLEQLPTWAKGLADDVLHASLERPLKACAATISAATKGYLQSSRGPDGQPWAPLKHPRHGKRHKGSSAKPLLDSGLLRASASAKGAAGHVEVISAGTLTYGTNLDYASFHQFGTRTIPARPFQGVGPDLQETLDNIVADWLAEQVAG